MYFNDDIKSLYIHVPFCSSKCSYCDFFSLENIDFKEKKAVTDETINQIKFYSDNFNFNNIETVYIGGGTPTSLPISLLEKLIFSITDIISNLKEFSIEVNPETLDKELAIFFNDTPVSRLSIGIQSFNDYFLKKLGRKSSSEICYNALDLAKITEKDINIDLISSIPGQKPEDGINDIVEALSFNPSHISLYSFTIEENTPIAKIHSIDDIDDDIWIKASDFLEDSGFINYEISNFSLLNKRCLHNMNYWKVKPYIGCGPASVSTVIKNNTPYRIFNTPDIQKYLEGKKRCWNNYEESITIKDFLVETLMMGFRTSEGIDIADIKKSYGIDISGIIPETILKWESKGLLKRKEKSLFLTRKGRLFHSSFIINIMNELERSKSSLS